MWHRLPDFQQIALKAIAGQVLRHTPGFAGVTEVQLFIPGELLRQHLRSTAPVVLYVSHFNPGAAELATELQAVYSAITTTSSMQSLSGGSDAPTHFMLYLNNDTFVAEGGAQLAEEVRNAMTFKRPIVMTHENDMSKGGCQFER